jgi:hypothetical protein
MNDIFNGIFEFGGALLTCLSIRRLLIDRAVAGVSWLPTAFFTAWGFWNLYYYPSLGQMFSFAGGAALVLANAVNVGLLLRFGGKA